MINPGNFDIILFEYIENVEGIGFVNNILLNWEQRYGKNYEECIFGLAHFDPSYFEYSSLGTLMSFLKKYDIYFEFNSSYPNFYSQRYKFFFRELKVNDRIVLGGRDDIIETKIRAILVPKPLDEIRDPKDRFNNVTMVTAAVGVKIAAPNLDNALSGSPIYVISDNKSQKERAISIKEEINELLIKTDRIGVVIKSDTLGSLEALINSLGRINIPIRLADVGDLSKRDIIEAEVVKIKDFLLGVVLCFNVNILPDAVKEIEDKKIPVFTSNIIYQLIEDYTDWIKDQRLEQVKAELDTLIRPGKIKVIQGYIFRRSKPAIIGVEVLSGIIKQKYPLLSPSKKRIGSILKIQEKSSDVQEAIEGSKVAVSIDDGVVGRNLYENDILYVDVPSNHAEILKKKYKDELSSKEFDLLKELEEYRLKK